jgi:AICAR transformylase/IMP cyclohydrolase PurH
LLVEGATLAPMIACNEADVTMVFAGQRLFKH